MFENDENTKFEKKPRSMLEAKSTTTKKSKNLFINKTHLLQLYNANY